ncbi:hypothetical protein GQR58_030319 [Nymphon striatum]|nr:hypothetical protein GQR58_030319 [Nymphon striatum]
MLTVLFKQAFDLTGDALAIGIVGLLQFVPAVLLVIVSGDIADRFDRRRVAAWMTVGTGGVCAGLLRLQPSGGRGRRRGRLCDLAAVSHHLGVRHVRCHRHSRPPRVGAAGGRARRPAQTGCCWRSCAGNRRHRWAGGSGLPPHRWAPTLRIWLPQPCLPPPSRRCCAIENAREQTLLTERPSLKLAFEGVRFIKRTPIVFASISLDMFAVLFGGAVALIPVIAEERLGVGNIAYGWLRAAPGIGAGLMGLVLATRPVTRRVGPTLLGVVATFAMWSRLCR